MGRVAVGALVSRYLTSKLMASSGVFTDVVPYRSSRSAISSVSALLREREI